VARLRPDWADSAILAALARLLRAAEGFALMPSSLRGPSWTPMQHSGGRVNCGRHLRAHLGAEQLDRAYGKGIALSFDDAFDLVLGRVQSPGLL
jgi:hypothetical protein